MATRTFEALFTVVRNAVVVEPSGAVVQCNYVMLRGENKCMQCLNMSLPGKLFCEGCLKKKAAHSQVQDNLTMVPSGPATFKLKFLHTSDLNYQRVNKIMTDIELTRPKVFSHFVHKLILVSSSGFFQKLFSTALGSDTRPDDQFVMSAPTAEVMSQYLDLLYGQTVEFKSWKEAFDLYDYLEYTSTNWNKDKAVLVEDVRPEEYSQYIERLSKVYHDEIPTEVLQHSAQFIKGTLDLSEFGEEFVKTVMLSPRYENSLEHSKKIVASLMTKEGYSSSLFDIITELSNRGKTPLDLTRMLMNSDYGANGAPIPVNGAPMPMYPFPGVPAPVPMQPFGGAPPLIQAFPGAPVPMQAWGPLPTVRQ